MIVRYERHNRKGAPLSATSAPDQAVTTIPPMPDSAKLRLQLLSAVVALSALVGMHALDTNAHVCHLESAAQADGGGHDDGHGHHEGSGSTSCIVVGCVAIVLAAAGLGAVYRRRPRSMWPPLVAAIASMTSGPEPPVPRVLQSI